MSRHVLPVSLHTHFPTVVDPRIRVVSYRWPGKPRGYFVSNAPEAGHPILGSVYVDFHEDRWSAQRLAKRWQKPKGRHLDR